MSRKIQLFTACFTILACLQLLGCRGEVEEESPDGELDTAFPTGKADSPYSECVLDHIAAYLNNPQVTFDTLKDEGVHSRAAANLIGHRDGPDGLPVTGDEDLFDTIEEVDDVAWVGPVAMSQLAALVTHLCDVVPSVEVIFSPQPYDASHLARAAEIIDGAEHTIDIAMYSMSDYGILNALERALQRGVSIRMIFEPARDERSAPEGTWSARLESTGIDVRYINKIMHHKFAIVDGPRDDMERAYTGVLMTGSGNWSNSAGTRYDENTAFIRGSGELLLLFQREFNLLWENSRDFEYASGFEWFFSTPVSEAMIVDHAATDAVYTSANFRTYVSSYGPTFSVVSGLSAVADRLVELIGGASESILIASGHLRSRPVAEALTAKHEASPEVDIRIYLDNQEYISEWYHDEQVQELEACLAEAGDSVSRQQDCYDKGFYFSYPVQAAGIPLRFKYYCYRWDYHYAEQMHHKYFIFDGKIVASGSYNLSDNAEHETLENMVIYEGSQFPDLVAAFRANFEALWETGRGEGFYEQLIYLIEETADPVPIVFEPMALDWDQVTYLKEAIRAACPAVDSDAYRNDPVSHQTCYR
jgi:phosphatidylserine/phosphatidylglycerophosphate/cardiolipin synthase-like enzyme